MNEQLDDATEELKRADHLIFVSLKYTRTVDVFISIFERMINFMGFVLDAFLQKGLDEQRMDNIPVSPMLKCEKVNELYPDEAIKKFTEFYIFLRKVLRSDYDKAREFRRHVTMTSYYEKDKSMDITTDLIGEWFDYMKEISTMAREKIEGEDAS
ncbi:MAG: hypothetical protein GXP63_05760 [DPANN group archaeon]|nr:hypothetical protein [DPANN group archaeon]